MPGTPWRSAPGAGAPAPGIIAAGSIDIAPPALPVYEQPPIPAPGYIFTPGYWSWGDAGYYWVPGTWVEPPSVGLLWTPGYWGFNGGVYAVWQLKGNLTIKVTPNSGPGPAISGIFID